MKKITLLILFLLGMAVILFGTNFVGTNLMFILKSNDNNINVEEKITADNLSEGFYIKKGEHFERIYNSGGYLDYDEHLIVTNKCYYENTEMNASDELVYVNDEEDISIASISYYEDLDFSTIGVPFILNQNNDFLYFGNIIGDAKFAMDGYNKVLSIDGEPIKSRISHNHFVNGLIADKEYTISCLKGTKIEDVKIKADCHILKSGKKSNKYYLDEVIAKTNWVLSNEGYVSLNKNFTSVYDDMTTFTRDGYYKISASVQGYHSNRVTSVLIKYKQ